jgi:murein DD-endopeptidase
MGSSRKFTKAGSVLWALAAAALLSGCSNAMRWEEPSTAYSSGGSASVQHAKAVSVAKSMIGVPYKWGGASPNGFDCSGLVQYAYNKAGLNVPRNSLAQYSASRQVSLKDAQVGDLVFFNFDRKISHVGIYLGGGRFVHAPSKGKRVQVASLQEAPYRQHFVGAGRIDRSY